jgi:hypothetical protein
VGRVCATLCKLTGDEYGEIDAPKVLLKAHVDSVKVMVHTKMMGAGHEIALKLVSELENQTKLLISQAPKA